VTRVSSFDVTLDTCVLFPITLCDTLLRLAEAGVFRPHWSKETLAELERNLVSKLGLSEKAARRRIAHMTDAFPEALVEGYEQLVPTMPTDPKDRHVAAAAVRSASQVIVTSNLSDFPPEALRQFDIEVQSPDVFLLHQGNLDVSMTVRLLRSQASEKSRPPRTVQDVLDRLATNAPTFSTAMRLLLEEATPVERQATKKAAVQTNVDPAVVERAASS
jgi:predicted nucleic acid-binding protein